jgi:hypothetical protein
MAPYNQNPNSRNRGYNNYDAQYQSNGYQGNRGYGDTWKDDRTRYQGENYRSSRRDSFDADRDSDDERQLTYEDENKRVCRWFPTVFIIVCLPADWLSSHAVTMIDTRIVHQDIHPIATWSIGKVATGETMMEKSEIGQTVVMIENAIGPTKNRPVEPTLEPVLPELLLEAFLVMRSAMAMLWAWLPVPSLGLLVLIDWRIAMSGRRANATNRHGMMDPVDNVNATDDDAVVKMVHLRQD